MSDAKKVMNFPIEDSSQVISLVEGLSKLNADIDADSTPSSIRISIYGSESKVKEVSKKVRKLVEESKSS